IKTVRELETDPDRNAKLYKLEFALERDVPSPEPITEVPFEEWMKLWDRPNLLPDAWFIAVHDGEYVGSTNLWKTQARDDLLYTGLTGVLREYRRKGIATALKLQAVRYAQTHGISQVRTWNAQSNEGMLGINVRLGFVRQPAYIMFTRKLREEEAEAAAV